VERDQWLLTAKAILGLIYKTEHRALPSPRTTQPLESPAPVEPSA
jgi:hypothetical protein